MTWNEKMAIALITIGFLFYALDLSKRVDKIQRTLDRQTRVIFGEWENICVAKLDDGTLSEYDYATLYNNDVDGFVYLGEGVIYSVNDVKQEYKGKLHFYRRTNDR